MMVTVVFTTTPTEVQAQSYTANFLYYVQDHLGSSSIVLDRAGARVQHYENFAYGNQRYNETSLGVTHRYTGQVFDEETGLYYYNARYYDPELGRFTQPDTIVPSPANPQTLNRYTYANNNPLVYTDPSGHLVWFAIPLILAAVGAVVGGVTAGLQGGNIGAGILGGAISGFGAGLGPLGAVAFGALGGAVSAAVSGGTGTQIATSALIGGIAGGIGYGIGQAVGRIADPVIREVAQFGTSVAVGSAIGAGAAWATGGNVAQGAMWGAIGGAVGYGVGKAAGAMMKPSPKAEEAQNAQKQEALETDISKNPNKTSPPPLKAPDSNTESYGPFHRLGSPTQTAEDALMQQHSGELWGQGMRQVGGGRGIPAAKAFIGPLPEGEYGIEFYTPIKPTQTGAADVASWYKGTPGVTEIDVDWVKIPINISRTTQVPAAPRPTQQPPLL